MELINMGNIQLASLRQTHELKKKKKKFKKQLTDHERGDPKMSESLLTCMLKMSSFAA